ncbi:hypothetical protein F2Q69_00011004 [Brassica cretica]|uniref:Uncharacterized protein n=1 Tax=Brassica cretica TaxID=69181 RepID=A0A8S9QSR5_BRACR|nr:hypothetical protein F2Q69_00011004 [Brassica cretica]
MAGEQSAGGTKSPFDKLERLELSNLQMLKSIDKSHLPFPCLKKIGVESFHLVLGVALVVMNFSSVTVMINGHHALLAKRLVKQGGASVL